MNEKTRLTEAVIRDLPPPPAKEKKIYKDYDPPHLRSRIAVPGLELVVSYSGVKSFVIRKKVNGRPVSVTLGRHPSINVDTARKLARKASHQMAMGKNPNQLKKALRASRITLGECFESYLSDRRLAKNTVNGYQGLLKLYLSDWLSKPMNQITRNMVQNKHTMISKSSPTSANKTMRLLSALFNYAHAKYETENGQGMFPDNPVDRLRALKLWHKEKPRRNKIEDSDFSKWFSAIRSPVAGGLSQTVSDLLVFILFTGLRRREASNLKWESVDMKQRSFTIAETKNNETLLLPMSDFVYQLLNKRRKQSESPYVFPGNSDQKPIQEPKKQVEKFRTSSGVEFTIHDLRRTFISIAESCEISPYAIKALVNHKLPERRSNDVTSDYIIWSLERLRQPMQKITDHILEKAHINESF